MIDKKFFKPGNIERWVVVVYERVQRFGENHARDMVNGLLQACSAVGTQTDLSRMIFRSKPIGRHPSRRARPYHPVGKRSR